MDGWMESLAGKVHKQVCHCYLYRDGCVKCSNVVEYALLDCALCHSVPPSSHPYIWKVFFEIFDDFLFLLFLSYCSKLPWTSSSIHPFPTSLISERNLCKNYLVHASKICYAMPPTHMQLMRQLAVNASSYPSMCTNKWRPTASTHWLLSLPCKKLQEWGWSYAQNEAQKNHPQRISWLLVAFLNATPIALRR